MQVLYTWGYQGQRSLFDLFHPTLCQQCALSGLHGDAKVPELYSRPSGKLWVDKVYPSVPMHQTHHPGGDHQDTPRGVVPCLWGTRKDSFGQHVRVRFDTGWYKRVMRSLNVQVSTGNPYTHMTNPQCERQIHVLKQNIGIWNTEHTND